MPLYGQKIRNTCRHSVCTMGLRAGRLGRAHRAMLLSTLRSAAGRGVGGGGC